MEENNKAEKRLEETRQKPVKKTARKKKAEPVAVQAEINLIEKTSEQEQTAQPAEPEQTTEQAVEETFDPVDLTITDVNEALKDIVEAILFAAHRTMTVKQVQQVFPELEQPPLKDIQSAINAIMLDYQNRPVELKKLATGYRFQVKPGMSPWITRLFEEKPPKYSRASLETLAIIIYRQPVTRGDIEDIRGVSVSSNIMRSLMDREWIRIVGHKDVPGRPALYGTTKQFLDYFNVSSIDQLPSLTEINDLELSIPNDNVEPTEDYREPEQTEQEEKQSEQTEADADAAEKEAFVTEKHTLH